MTFLAWESSAWRGKERDKKRSVLFSRPCFVMHFATHHSKEAFGLQVNPAGEGGTGYFCWWSTLGQEQPLKKNCGALWLFPARCFPRDRGAKQGQECILLFQAGAGRNIARKHCECLPHRTGGFSDGAHESGVNLSEHARRCLEACRGWQPGKQFIEFTCRDERKSLMVLIEHWSPGQPWYNKDRDEVQCWEAPSSHASKAPVSASLCDNRNDEKQSPSSQSEVFQQ